METYREQQNMQALRMDWIAGAVPQPWWEWLREQFPAVKRCTYFDTAYDCGGSLLGRRAAQRYFDDWEYAARANERGGPGRATMFRILDETRELLGKLLGGASAEQIAFTRNTNDGINAILQGFDFQPGDNLVVSEAEHASVFMPALNAKKTRGVSVRILPRRADHTVPVQELIRLADEHTRMILVSHVQSAAGSRADLAQLGGWCAAHGVYLIVDAIQSLGLQPFHAVQWGVSAVSAAAYKGLGSVNSVGFLYCVPELLQRVWPVYAAAGPYMSAEKTDQGWALSCSDPSKARKLENSSMDNLGIYILHDVLQVILEIGPDRIWEHVNGLYNQLYEGMDRLGYQIVTPRMEEGHCGIMAVCSENRQKIFDYFRMRNVALSISAGAYLRFSIGAWNNEMDVNRVLEIAKDCRWR